MTDSLYKHDEMRDIAEYCESPKSSTNRSLKKVTFKPYSTHDNYLFPPSVNDYLPDGHIAKFISAVIDHIGIDYLIDNYKGGGASAYHPAMMLKVWILGCIYKIYSCRELEKALRENVPFIWISGNQQPDFRTLNNFRLLLEDDVKEIFKRVIGMVIDLGLVDAKEVFIDHTKIEANANRHKITWRKTVEKQLEKYNAEIDDLFKHINELNIGEIQESSESPEPKEWNEEDLDNAISKINEELKEKQREKDEGKEIKKNYVEQRKF
jgi:transposase